MPAADRIGLPASVDELITRHVDAVMGELGQRYSKALANNPAGTALVAKVVRKAVVSGLLAQIDVDGRFVGHLPPGGPQTWESWQRRHEGGYSSSGWPARLASSMPEAVSKGGAAVASAGAEVGMRERRAGELRLVGEQAVEAGGALVRCLTEPDRPPA